MKNQKIRSMKVHEQSGYNYKAKSGELYQAYRAHCMQNGEYIRSTTDFYSSMDKAGYNRIRKNTGVQVVGLKLKEGQDFLE